MKQTPNNHTNPFLSESLRSLVPNTMGSLTPVNVSSNYKASFNQLVIIDATAPDFSITLPTITTIGNHILFINKGAGTNNITIIPSPNTLINNQTYWVISTAYQVLHLIAVTTTQWIIL